MIWKKKILNWSNELTYILKNVDNYFKFSCLLKKGILSEYLILRILIATYFWREDIWRYFFLRTNLPNIKMVNWYVFWKKKNLFVWCRIISWFSLINFTLEAISNINTWSHVMILWILPIVNILQIKYPICFLSFPITRVPLSLMYL